MGLFDTITGWIRKESADIGDAIDDAATSLDRDLDRKERELAASPEERLAMIQEQIDDDPFAAIRDRIEATTAHADAEADVDALDGPVLDGSDETMIEEAELVSDEAPTEEQAPADEAPPAEDQDQA